MNQEGVTPAVVEERVPEQVDVLHETEVTNVYIVWQMIMNLAE